MTETLAYHREGDYLIANVAPEEGADKVRKWAEMFLNHMEESHPHRMVALKVSGKLLPMALERQEEAEATEEKMKIELMEKYQITNQLHSENPMEWIRRTKQIDKEVQRMIMQNIICKVDSMDNKNKMLIELDREKIEREQIFDIEEMEACIEKRFAAANIYKDEKGYYGGSFVKLGAIVFDLSDTEWFLDNAKTWLWLTLENNTDNSTDDDYSYEDFLIQFRRFREEDKKQIADGRL